MTFCIARREFITLLGGAAAAWPLAAHAQQGERVRRIGVLVSGGEDDREMQARSRDYARDWRIGWSDGRNLLENRYASASTDRQSRRSQRSWSPCDPM